MRDPLRYTFDDARRQLLLDGIAMSTAEKVVWFEEMVELMVTVGAINRLTDKQEGSFESDVGRGPGGGENDGAEAPGLG